MRKELDNNPVIGFNQLCYFLASLPAGNRREYLETIAETSAAAAEAVKDGIFMLQALQDKKLKNEIGKIAYQYFTEV